MSRVPVLFLEPTLVLGGAEQVLYYVVTRIDRERFAPVVCCLKQPGAIGEAIAAEGVPLHHGLTSRRYSPRVLPALVDLMRRERIQVVHTINQPLTTFWGVVAGRLAGVPIQVTSVHSTRSPSHAGRARLVNRALRPFLDAVVALADSHREYLIAEEGMDPARVRVVRNGIDLSRFQGGGRLRRADLGLPEEAPVAGVLAVLRREKAHDNFLAAAALVRETLPFAHFVVIGDGPERENLERLAQSLRLDGRVHFLGRRRDVADVLPLLDVSVLPSRNTETFPLAVLESMAAGRPVVATDVGSLREIVVDGETGLLVPPEDVRALAAAVSRLLADAALARRMGEAGLRRARQFDVRRMVREMEDLFSDLLRTKTVRPAASADEPGLSAR